ncbi:hypothetical protein J5N97_001956 [Dioscorea zingiberensis]|uniref:DUF3444 domain-containing protein n=1 Tax=Dioscorea zingiberensis TaxID=325984 RepID=A0A9D5BT47_9LILI|nr:hypothetical protein J5N97_001956 [Dioscorea zingiberensis]
MECNRDEALRAKEIAERKFSANDLMGAKKFALKAQNLFPALEGINQMIVTLDVYLAGEVKINGAEGAFKLISEAWSVLSDKGKKLLYDQKRDAKEFQQKVSKSFKEPSAPNAANVFNNSTNQTTSGARVRRKSNYSKRSTPSAAPSSLPKASSFWTSCPFCKILFEYLRMYLNCNLLCPNCKKAFCATETVIPNNGPNSTSSTSASQHQQHNVNHNSVNDTCVLGRNTDNCRGMGAKDNQHGTKSDVHTNDNYPWGPFSRKAGAASANASSTAAAKRLLWSIRHMRKLGKRRRSISGDLGANYRGANTKQDVQDAQRNGKGGNSISGFKVTCNVSKESPHLGIRSLLMEKAKVGIKEKLEEWNSAAAAKSTEKEKAKRKQKPEDIDNRKPAVAATNINNATTGIVSIDVPDPDFYDFDKHRSEKSFGSDQVWATYDNEDGMPRFYALVQKVISLKPFKIRISFLTSKTNSEFGSLDWVGSGFAKTCGDFRVGRYVTNDTVNIFSHRVQWEKGLRGIIKIIPRKGDTWALYKNWSPDWNEHTADSVIYKYEMVEVLDDYNEDQGVSITPLLKVAGFKTVFHRHLDPKKIRRIPKEEMFRFSHQVPSYILTGEEAHNAPKGCCELDPAATPMELLQNLAKTDDRLRKLLEGKSLEITRSETRT